MDIEEEEEAASTDEDADVDVEEKDQPSHVTSVGRVDITQGTAGMHLINPTTWKRLYQEKSIKKFFSRRNVVSHNLNECVKNTHVKITTVTMWKDCDHVFMHHDCMHNAP